MIAKKFICHCTVHAYDNTLNRFVTLRPIVISTAENEQRAICKVKKRLTNKYQYQEYTNVSIRVDFFENNQEF
jgi:hypothetical protein